MSKLLVHLATGPENPTRGALAFLVARTAGDAVGYLRDATMDAAQGIGTGAVREHWTALAGAGVPVYASGMSSKARALDASGLGDKAVELAPPDKLVQLMIDADTVVTY
jgi:predicted peroxiredoxin